jgi:stress response protein SCP2
MISFDNLFGFIPSIVDDQTFTSEEQALINANASLNNANLSYQLQESKNIQNTIIVSSLILVAGFTILFIINKL